MSNIKFDKNNTIEIQALKLIMKFAVEHNVIDYCNNCNQEDFFDDFVLNSFNKIYTYSKGFKYFDESKGKLSTYIYTCLKKSFYVLIYQTRYNCSRNTAEVISKNYVNDKKDNYRKALLCQNSNSIYADTKTLKSKNNEVNLDSILNINNDTSFEEEFEDTELYKNKVQQVFDFLEKYKDTYKTSEKTIEILKYWIDNIYDKKITQAAIAKTFGVSKQRINDIIFSFRKRLKQKGITIYS